MSRIYEQRPKHIPFQCSEGNFHSPTRDMEWRRHLTSCDYDRGVQVSKLLPTPEGMLLTGWHNELNSRVMVHREKREGKKSAPDLYTFFQSPAHLRHNSFTNGWTNKISVSHDVIGWHTCVVCALCAYVALPSVALTSPTPLILASHRPPKGGFLLNILDGPSPGVLCLGRQLSCRPVSLACSLDHAWLRCQPLWPRHLDCLPKEVPPQRPGWWPSPEWHALKMTRTTPPSIPPHRPEPSTACTVRPPMSGSGGSVDSDDFSVWATNATQAP
jgi:hypothetical protein